MISQLLSILTLNSCTPLCHPTFPRTLQSQPERPPLVFVSVSPPFDRVAFLLLPDKTHAAAVRVCHSMKPEGRSEEKKFEALFAAPAYLSSLPSALP